MNETALSIDIIEAFKQVTRALDDLGSCVREDGKRGYHCWVSHDEFTGKNIPHREKVVTAIKQLSFLKDQDRKTTISFPGLVIASQKTLRAVEAANSAKDAFKEAVIAFKKEQAIKDEEVADLFTPDLFQQRDENLAAALRRAGIAKLSLKQVYRHIPVSGYKDKELGTFVIARPVSVSWTWAHKRSIVSTPISDEIERLKKQGFGPKETEKYEKMLKDVADRSPLGHAALLARVQDNAPRLLSNLVIQERKANGAPIFNENDNPVYVRPQASAGLPLFIPHEDENELPKFRDIPVNKAKDDFRQLRSDKTVESEPFIKPLRLYRYKEQVS